MAKGQCSHLSAKALDLNGLKRWKHLLYDPSQLTPEQLLVHGIPHWGHGRIEKISIENGIPRLTNKSVLLLNKPVTTGDLRFIAVKEPSEQMLKFLHDCYQQRFGRVDVKFADGDPVSWTKS